MSHRSARSRLCLGKRACCGHVVSSQCQRTCSAAFEPAGVLSSHGVNSTSLRQQCPRDVVGCVDRYRMDAMQQTDRTYTFGVTKQNVCIMSTTKSINCCVIGLTIRCSFIPFIHIFAPAVLTTSQSRVVARNAVNESSRLRCVSTRL